jgi:hypothetical protein
MGKLTFLLLMTQLIFISASCTKYDQRLEVTDLKKAHVLILQKKPNQKHVYSMGIHCYGKLEGEAQLVFMLNGTPYKTERMKGKVNIDWGGDWYSDSMELRYQPSSITSGQLVIEYTFTDLREVPTNGASPARHYAAFRNAAFSALRLSLSSHKS